MGGCGGNDGLGLADLAVDFREALQEPRNGSRADGDVPSDLNVTETQFARYQVYAFPGGLIFDPSEVFG